ncbi:MAG: DUF3343 domain-containing protein [Clostridiales bacterium]|jgi:hypothetical protein|nr:DUF3343 domain-containing protein [Clostridiales bacterium]
MGKPLILVSSITYAMKGRDLLSKQGISAYLERVPHIEALGGCGYGLNVPRHTDEAEELLQQAGIRVLGRIDKEGPQ